MPKTIILIDDDSDDLHIMKQAIETVDPNLFCISFIYPEEAIKVLLRKEMLMLPDFIFIDINMPVMSGDKCLKALRQDSDFNNISITLYSTAMPPAVSEALKYSGATHTFQKPVKLKGYVEILERIINHNSK